MNIERETTPTLKGVLCEPISTSVSGFTHRQYAHCESGVSSNLFQHAGAPISEAMAFGIGSGLFFVHLPFVKIMGLPLTSYRSLPSSIFQKCCSRLNVAYKCERFRSPEKGESRLNDLLSQKKVAAVQSNIFWLPYMPERFRFPFNAHNLIVVKKSKNTYLVSDPVLEETMECPVADMTKARFRKGPLAPKGLIYYIDQSLEELSPQQLKLAIFKGIRETAHRMLYIPFPFFGGRAVKYLGSRVQQWHKTYDQRQFSLLLTNVVRMQEEIGTGGAGFRFLFARFLEEAAEYFPTSPLGALSQDFLLIGDKWRRWAWEAVQVSKLDNATRDQIENLSTLLFEIYQDERRAFQALHTDFVKIQRL